MSKKYLRGAAQTARDWINIEYLGAPDATLAKQLGITAVGQNTQTNAAHLTRLAELVDQGAVKPEIDKTFPMDQVRDAFSYLEKESPRGKVVLKIKK